MLALLTKSARGVLGIGGGAWKGLPAPQEFYASSVQVCGLWPMSVGSARPVIGTPLGHDMDSLSTVCCDPIEWFRAGLISNPSIMLFGLPGLGKSSLAARMVIGCAFRGIPPLIFGDLKPDYPELIEALGGIVVKVGPGFATINPLDLGALGPAAEKIGGESGEALMTLAHQKSVELVTAIAQVVRGGPLDDYEEMVLSVAVRIVRDTHEHPRLSHVAELLESGHDELLHLTLSETLAEFRETIKRLHRTVLSLLHGRMGQVFGAETSVPIPVDNPGGVCIDISNLAQGDERLLAAVMLATWAHGFAAVDAQWELSQHGHAEWRGFLTVQDELWRPLRASSGLVDRLDSLSRVNRAQGVGEVRITHSPKDADSLATPQDRAKARGFAERAGMLGILGLDGKDLATLAETVSLSRKEIQRAASWRTPPSWRASADANGNPKPPPGAGKVLLKVGGRAAIPVQVKLTDAEKSLHNTNARWTEMESTDAMPRLMQPAGVAS